MQLLEAGRGVLESRLFAIPAALVVVGLLLLVRPWRRTEATVAEVRAPDAPPPPPSSQG